MYREREAKTWSIVIQCNDHSEERVPKLAVWRRSQIPFVLRGNITMNTVNASKISCIDPCDPATLAVLSPSTALSSTAQIDNVSWAVM